MDSSIAILILAAGASSRMGESKQLLTIDGQPLLRKMTVEAIHSTIGPVVVVLGAQAQVHIGVINDLPVDTVVHEAWEKGMGSSLKKGIQFIQETFPTIKAVLVMLCDQPYLTSSHLIQLVSEYRQTGKKIVASTYHETVGVPALFDKVMFPELLQLPDAEGARRLFKLFTDEMSRVHFPLGEIDLDTPADYARMPNK
jgi:molybdenum cofactor cytidylyltransferase